MWVKYHAHMVLIHLSECSFFCQRATTVLRVKTAHATLWNMHCRNLNFYAINIKWPYRSKCVQIPYYVSIQVKSEFDFKLLIVDLWIVQILYANLSLFPPKPIRRDLNWPKRWNSWCDNYNFLVTFGLLSDMTSMFFLLHDISIKVF